MPAAYTPPVRVSPRPVGCATAFVVENLGETGWSTTPSGVVGSSPPIRFDYIVLILGYEKRSRTGKGWGYGDDDGDANDDILTFVHLPETYSPWSQTQAKHGGQSVAAACADAGTPCKAVHHCCKVCVSFAKSYACGVCRRVRR